MINHTTTAIELSRPIQARYHCAQNGDRHSWAIESATPGDYETSSVYLHASVADLRAFACTLLRAANEHEAASTRAD